MKNISLIELQEDQLDNINAAGAGSFFKKVGKGLGTGLSKVGGFTKGCCKALRMSCEIIKDELL